MRLSANFFDLLTISDLYWSLDYDRPFRKISQIFDQYFFSNPVDRQSDKHTGENSAFSAIVTTVHIFNWGGGLWAALTN